MKNTNTLFSWLLICFLTCSKHLFSLPLAEQKPYVIVVSFDGFRWDYTNRNLTPTLNAIQHKGVHAVQLEPCYPSKTFPNHISILTGMYPENHGIISNHFINPFTKEKYSLKDSVSVRDAKWYQGEFFWETAQRNGVVTASYFWPGSELLANYRRPNYFKAYQHQISPDTIFKTLYDWLTLPQAERPHFITLYFHDVDDAGHRFGPHSAEVNAALVKIDSITKQLLATVAQTPLADSMNFIFVSDHGMTAIDSNRIVYLPDTLSTMNAKIHHSWENVMVECNDQNQESAIFNLLKKQELHYKVYLKKDIPKRFHFNKHPFISNILIVPEVGWVLGSHQKEFNPHKVFGGTHGYDNQHADMKGIFIAQGSAFKNQQTLPSIKNIDIYPLLCKLFAIEPRSNIDGRLNRIQSILK